jgi:hypothetical protein
MQSLKQSIIIPIPARDCLQLWISANCYPNLPIVNLQPEMIPTHWSSADAWGENRLHGHSQLEWSLNSLPGNPHSDIIWHKEFCLKEQLIQVSGHVEFEPRKEKQTRITVSIQCGDTVSSEQLSGSLQQCLNRFKAISLETLRSNNYLKIAI